MAKTPQRPAAGRTAIWIADRDRAIFYRALSRLLETGMPLEQALSLANDGLPSEFQKALESAALRVSKGTSIVQAFVTTGLIPRRDRGILSAAEATGMYVPVFARLADLYHQRWQRSARMKARFVFPLAVLVLAIFVQPLPAVVSGELSIQAYLAHSSAYLAVVLLGTWLIRRSLRQWGLNGMSSLSASLVASVAPLKRLSLMQARVDFLHYLALLWRAGVSPEQAVSHAQLAVINPLLAKKIARVVPALRDGAPFAESLERTELLSEAEDLALLRTGEASGQLDAMLERLAELHGCRLADVYDLIADWTPRLAYALVALIIVNGLVT